MIFIFLIGGFISFLCLFFAFKQLKKRHLIDNLPTSKTTGVFIGLTELKGSAESDSPLTAFLSELPCVYYSWSVEEHWSRTVWETYTDSEGRSHRRTKQESGWTTLTAEEQAIPFYIKDDYGVVQVVPHGAKIEALPTFIRECMPDDEIYLGKGPPGHVPDSTLKRRFQERSIPLHTELFVVGRARERKDIVAAEIAADPSSPIFLITTKEEKKISSRFGWGFWGLLILGAVLVVGTVFFGLLSDERRPKAGPFLIGLSSYLLLFVLGWSWMVYNGLIELRQRVRQAWSQVEIQLKRRYDLIPNLLNAVKGLQQHEQTLFEEISKIRAQMQATPPGVAGPDYEAVRQTVQIVVEKYPQLKSNESFLFLQKSLIDTEHRIALARGYFNEIATYYNSRIEVFPEKLIALVAGARPQPLMAVNAFERASVWVTLAR